MSYSCVCRVRRLNVSVFFAVAPSKELVDVTFIMGASGPEADNAFEKQKEVILSFVDALKTNDARLAIVNYDDNSSDVRAKIGEYKDKEDFKKCVDKQKRTGEGKIGLKGGFGEQFRIIGNYWGARRINKGLVRVR